MSSRIWPSVRLCVPNEIRRGRPRGLDIISIEDPERPELLYRWRIEDQELHLGTRRYGREALQGERTPLRRAVAPIRPGRAGPRSGARWCSTWRVSRIHRGVSGSGPRIREPLLPGGFHNIFVYKHSDGRVLLFTTVSGPYANAYDLAKIVEGASPEEALAGRVPNPQVSASGSRGYHDFYAAYHPDTDEDRFYGGGAGGYYVYDITNLEAPELRISLTGISGVANGHTFTPSSDGRYVVAESEYEFAPLRIFDLQPALEGRVQTIRRPISGWTADYRNLVHNHEVRWPWLFVSGYLDGLQVVSLQDPANPVTVGYYDTYIGPRSTTRTPVFNGAFGIDVAETRDGLILISDMSTGFWTFRMDGFQGWNGESWGVPDISSAQKWDEPTRRPISD